MRKLFLLFLTLLCTAGCGSKEEGHVEVRTSTGADDNIPSATYVDRLATELFRDEVLPDFIEPSLLDDISWYCEEENYLPLVIKTSNYQYNCHIDYLGKTRSQSFVLIFKTDGTFTTREAENSDMLIPNQEQRSDLSR